MYQTDRGHKRITGFTLIELLVVMAITVILLGLIFGPLTQSFNLTNQARVQVLVQDTARRIMEVGQRDLSNAVFIFDNTPRPGAALPGDTHRIALYVRDTSGNIQPIGLDYGYIDLVPPARLFDQNPVAAGAPIDPTTGLPVESARGPLSLPLAPGRVIVRYFLGLRDNRSEGGVPVKPYGNFYEDMRNLSLNTANPVVLYRAEVSPYLPNGQVDTRFFHVYPAGSPFAGQPIIFDPNFFYDSTQAPSNLPPVPGFVDVNGDGQASIWENWRAVSRPLMDVTRADEVAVTRDNNGNVVRDSNGIPLITPLVRFQPTYVGNDSGAPSSISDPGNEAAIVPASSDIGAYGHWTTPFRVSVARTNGTYFTYDCGMTSNFIMAQPAGVSTGFDPLNPNPVVASSQNPGLMFTVDPRRGMVNFAFPATIFQGGGPYLWTGTPGGDLETVNQNYQQYKQSNPTASAYRYISLLNLPANRTSPLASIPDCIIVPGSEVVKGPDMRPGPHYGQEITYTRVPRMNADINSIGPNEYMINYTYMANANDPYAAPTPTNDPMQDALLEKGTIIFDSQDGQTNDLPVGANYAPVTVSFQIQNNRPGDIVQADYLTRQLMTFTLGVRLYEQHTGQPQQVTLTQKINIRNLQR